MLLSHISCNHDQISTNFSVFNCVISVNAGLVSTWRMMEKLAWMLTNALLPFLVASDASTLTDPTSACVWMATKPWNATPIYAKLCRVSLLCGPSPCRFSVRNCESQQSTDTKLLSFQLKSLFSLWRTTMRSGSWVWMAQITQFWSR